MLSGHKDKVDVHDMKGAIYEIRCNQCDAAYIGQSGQCIKSRLYRHVLGSRNDDFDHYPLAEHAKKMQHDIDWHNVRILQIERNLTKRLESFLLIDVIMQ